jgi:hypothetical protein
MPLTSEPFPLPPERLVGPIQSAIGKLTNAPDRDARLTLVGPFRCFTGEIATFAAGATRRGLEPAGWRALVLAGGEPCALADIQTGPDDGAEPRVAVRGPEPARAFQAALEAAQQVAGEVSQSYEARFVTFPSLFLTAVWLAGPRSLFIPTRIRAGERPEARAYPRDEFVSLVRSRAARMRRPIRPAADARPEEASNAPALPLANTP